MKFNNQSESVSMAWRLNENGVPSSEVVDRRGRTGCAGPIHTHTITFVPIVMILSEVDETRIVDAKDLGICTLT